MLVPNTSIMIIISVCITSITPGRLSRVSAQLCKVRPRGRWKTDRTRRTRWARWRRRWSRAPPCPCSPTWTTHKSQASRKLQAVDHGGELPDSWHSLSSRRSPHYCASVWCGLGSGEWERHIAACHRSPDNLHSQLTANPGPSKA